MFPTALITGNTMVVKPSERDPGALMFLMQLAQDAGFPDGTVNVLHGARNGLLLQVPTRVNNSLKMQTFSLPN